MTFQQEERRREELRKQEEDKRRQQLEEQQRRSQEEEMKKRQEEEMKRRHEEEMKRRQEEEMKRRHEEEMRRRQEEEMRRRQEEEIRRKQEEEKKRAEFERQQILRKQEEEERKRQEVLRFEQLKKEEELKRQEEMRLEQEMRRQYELQQRKEKQARLEQEQREAEAARQSSSVRDHIPKIPKNKSFEAAQDRAGEVKHEDHLGTVKTGQVMEKRNFWMRSSSVDRGVNSVGLSPAPRRRRIDWQSQGKKENEDPESRPGSSLGQANTGSVRNLSSGFLAKSKSSAAVMQDEVVERGRPKQRNLLSNGWTKEKYDQEVKQEFFKSQEVRTNKVQETLQTFGKKESSAGSVSGRSTPAPSRNIGEVFAENKIGRSAVEKSSAQANSWRTKTPEPTVKLVNVSVEKAAGSTQNIHISENAQRQMASFITSNTVEQQSHMTNTTNTMSSQSSVTSHSLSSSSGQVQQPPPAPERLESYGGKSAQLASVSGSELAELDSSQANIEQSVNRPSPPRPPNTASLQSSMSTQSINSVLSTCSSSKIPLPVKNAWFEDKKKK